LSFDYYDKSLFDEASRTSGIKRECFERSDEKNPIPTMGIEMGFNAIYGTPFAASGQLFEDKIFKFLSDTICKIADGDRGAVIVGRCADYILRGRDDLFSVFVHAPLDDRVRRTCQHEGLSAKEALDKIKKTDKQRASFYNFYSDGKWGDATTYDLCIDSSFTGIDKTCDLLASVVRTITDNER
ncbi:MAG: cytidylate kinase-like family protein, partial [Rikenellaceae bacterium]|nr:cytidylate kinase-like family protein [Rikenellaceae bacterium]